MHIRYLILCLLILVSISIGLSQKPLDYNTNVLIPYNDQGRWGYADTLGNILCSPQFDSVSFFEVWHNTHAIVKQNGKYGIIDSSFKWVVAPQYGFIKGTNCCPKEDVNFFQVGNGKRWGLRSSSGKQILPIKFADIDLNFLIFGYIAAKKKEKYAVFSLDGEKVSDYIFDNFAPGFFGGGDVMDLMGGTDKGYLLIKADKSIVPVPEEPNVFSGKILDPNAPPKENLPADEKLKYQAQSLDIKAKYGLDSIYTARPLWKTPYKGDWLLVMVSQNGKKGVWNVKNGTVKFNEYEDMQAIHPYSTQVFKKYGFNELWYVKQNGKWGVVTETGKIQAPFEYDGFGKITDSFAETIQQRKSGAIIYFTYYGPIACRYDSIDFLQQIEVSKRWSFGLYKISKNGRTGYVGENGIEFFKFE